MLFGVIVLAFIVTLELLVSNIKRYSSLTSCALSNRLCYKMFTLISTWIITSESTLFFWNILSEFNHLLLGFSFYAKAKREREEERKLSFTVAGLKHKFLFTWRHIGFAAFFQTESSSLTESLVLQSSIIDKSCLVFNTEGYRTNEQTCLDTKIKTILVSLCFM